MAKHGVTEFLRIFEDVGSTFFSIETDYLVVLDESGDIARVNPAFERALGRTEQEMLGQGLTHLVLVDDLAKFLQAFTAIQPEPFRLLHKDCGEVRCRLVACRFKQKRGFIVLRKV